MLNKKIILLLTVLLMAAVLSGCCLKHEWADATCEMPKTCVKCEKTEGEALGHSWQDATCEDPMTCASCGKTDGEALGHKVFWTKVDKENMSGSCETCGTSFNEALDWALLGPCNVQGKWTCVDHPEITVTVAGDGTAELVIDGQPFALTWEFDSVEDSLMGEVVNFWFETPFGREKAVLATILDNMFIMNIYTQPFTFGR